MPDFNSLLDKRVDDAERPPTIPAGIYEGLILKYQVREVDYTKGKGEPTPVCTFSVRLTGPTEDIDAEDLVVDGKQIELTKRPPMRIDFNLNEEEIWRLSEFLRTIGIDTSGRSFKETLPETANQPCFATVAHKPNPNNPDEPYVNIVKLVGTENVEG